MRLILVTPYPLVPSISGGRLRSQNLAQQLLDRGHWVDNWVVSAPDEPPAPWPVPASRLTTHHLPGRVRAGRLAKLSSMASRFPESVWACPPTEMPPGSLDGVDVAVLAQAHVGRFMTAFRRHGIPVVLNAHNVETELVRHLAAIAPTWMSSQRFRLDARRFSRFEPGLLDEASMVTAVSPVDAARLQAMAPTARIEVVPSGADVEGITWVDHREVRSDRLVLLGTLGYLPNLDGANWFAGEILPLVRAARPAAHLALVGSSPPTGDLAFGGPGIDVVGPVDSVDAELAAADVFVVPLRAGSGVRLKLLEAFAHGIPVVSTSIGAEGIDVEDGVHLLIADDAAGFAAATIRLLEDPDLRVRLSTAARERVEERYDWRAIGARYEALLASVALNGARS